MYLLCLMKWKTSKKLKLNAPKHKLKQGLQKMLEHCLNHMGGNKKVKEWPKGDAKGKEFRGKKINECLWGEGGVGGWGFSSPFPLKNIGLSNHQHIFSIWKGGKIKRWEKDCWGLSKDDAFYCSFWLQLRRVPPSLWGLFFYLIPRLSEQASWQVLMAFG